jgi:hypothetical protein
MKLSFLLTSLELVCIIVCVRGGLRSRADGSLEVNDPLEVIYDDESSHRHGVEMKAYHHEETRAKDQSSSHVSAYSRQLVNDPLSPGISSAALRMSCFNSQRAVLISESVIFVR